MLQYHNIKPMTNKHFKRFQNYQLMHSHSFLQKCSSSDMIQISLNMCKSLNYIEGFTTKLKCVHIK